MNMNFSELVLNRESVRKYKDKPIKREDIIKCVEAARLAPSACNSQPWTFVVVDDPSLVKKVSALTCSKLLKFNKFTTDAKAMVAVVMEKTNISSKVGKTLTDLEYNFIDLGISTEHFCLQAADLGIGTCILGYFSNDEVKKMLNVDSNKKIGLLISMGYSKFDTPRKKIRKSLDDVCKFNSYK